MESNMKALKDNLSRITANGSLVKLNLAPGRSMDLRLEFVKANGLEANSFDAALLIYVCNVLEESGMADYQENRKTLITDAGKVVLKYFEKKVLLQETEMTLPGLMSVSLKGDHWSNYKIAPSMKVLQNLDADMDRLYNVWNDITFGE